MAKLGNERAAVQSSLVKYVCQISWEYVKTEESERMRGGRTGLVFREVFANQLRKLNAFVDSSMIDEKIKELERLPARKEGNLQAWEYLKGLRTVFLQKEKEKET